MDFLEWEGRQGSILKEFVSLGHPVVYGVTTVIVRYYRVARLSLGVFYHETYQEVTNSYHRSLAWSSSLFTMFDLLRVNGLANLAVAVSSVVVMTPMHGENLLKKQTTHKFFYCNLESKISPCIGIIMARTHAKDLVPSGFNWF